MISTSKILIGGALILGLAGGAFAWNSGALCGTSCGADSAATEEASVFSNASDSEETYSCSGEKAKACSQSGAKEASLEGECNGAAKAANCCAAGKTECTPEERAACMASSECTAEQKAACASRSECQGSKASVIKEASLKTTESSKECASKCTKEKVATKVADASSSL